MFVGRRTFVQLAALSAGRAALAHVIDVGDLGVSGRRTASTPWRQAFQPKS